MIESLEDEEDRLLMSDSLVGMVPDLEKQEILNQADAFLVSALEVETENGIEIIAGSVVGLSIDEDILKVDMRTSINKSFNLIKSMKYFSNIHCRYLYLQQGREEIIFEGIYTIKSPRILDFDHKERMCTLGVDLIKLKQTE